MKKTRLLSIHKFLKLGLFACISLLYLFIFFTSATVTHTAALACSPFPYCLVTPTSALTPTPTLTATFILTPTLTPTPQAVPTQQEQRISVMPSSKPAMADIPTPAAPTMTPAPTATLVPASPSSVTPRITNTSHIKQQPQDIGDKGTNTVMLPLGVGAAVLLVSGGVFLLIWRRQSKQNKPILQELSGNISFSSTQFTPFNQQQSLLTNNHEMLTIGEIPQYGASPAFAPSMSGVQPMLGSSQTIPSPQPAYTPSELRPMTSALPQHMLALASDTSISSAQNGDLQPLPMDISLPFPSNSAGIPNMNGQSLLPLAQPMARVETPIPSPPSLLPAWMEGPMPSTSSSLPTWMESLTPSAPSSLPAWMEGPPPSSLPISPAIPLAIQPPSLREDPILEKTMRQAQIGLFILSGRNMHS